MRTPLPTSAVWRLASPRDGVEVVFLRDRAPRTFHGATSALDGEDAWAVGYEVSAGDDWMTRTTTVQVLDGAGRRTVRLEHDGTGRWQVDGVARPDLDGCLDVDLETSVLTNAFPVLREGLRGRTDFAAPAAYVRADGSVSRLEQTYAPLTTASRRSRFAYAAPQLGFSTEIAYDDSGLVVDYPDVAARLR